MGKRYIPEFGSFENESEKIIVLAESDKKLPNILLLGDSISIGYHNTVVQLLKDRANVKRPTLESGDAENCLHTGIGLENIERWLGDIKWDLIHFNWGLHDLKRIDPAKGMDSDDPKLPPVNDLEKYKENYCSIIETLKKTNAKLIMATTTPFSKDVRPCRIPKDVAFYNDIAIEIANKNDIPINDLYAYAITKLNEIQIESNVHFTAEGSYKLGIKVVEIIEQQL